MTGPPRPRLGAPGPGPGAGLDRDPERASILHARIAIVATIVVGQLWGLTVALNEWMQGRTRPVWFLLGFEALSFVASVALWLAAPRNER